MIINISEAVAKTRTIDGLPAVMVTKETPNAAGKPSEGQVIAIFRDDEIGNALADELVERVNQNKIRL